MSEDTPLRVRESYGKIKIQRADDINFKCPKCKHLMSIDLESFIKQIEENTFEGLRDMFNLHYQKKDVKERD